MSRYSHIVRKGGAFRVLRATGLHDRHEFLWDPVARLHRLESATLAEWHERERDLRAARALPWSIEGEIAVDAPAAPAKRPRGRPKKAREPALT